MDKSIYLGFAVMELSTKLMFGTHYDKFQPYSGEKNYNYNIWTVMVLY